MLRAIFLFYFLSGFSALIFEVCWVRELSLSLGNTAQATSTVLAVFMAGLAIGSFIAGKTISKNFAQPLALYGALEIGVGITAVMVGQYFRIAPTLYAWLYHSLSAEALPVIRILVAACAILVPTILMGGTLPVMVRYLEQFQLSSRMFSLIYGLNTLGAAAGSLAACFVGLAYLGVQSTMLSAAALNCIVGLASISLNRKTSPSCSPLPLEAAAPVLQEISTRDSDGIAISVLSLIAFMTGFTSLSYEVLWTRILRFYLSSLTYSFTIMISTFLLGLAIGSFIYERYVLSTRSSQHPIYLSFGIVQYLAAAACATSIPVILKGVDIQIPLEAMGLLPLRQMYSVPQYQLLYTLLVSLMALLVPAILLGILFPMIGTLAADRANQPARAVGIVYAFNTIGCVTGSLATGLLLIPGLGSYTAFKWIVVGSTFTGGLFLLFAKKIRPALRLALVCLPVLAAGIYFHNFNVGVASGRDRKTLAVGEDAIGSMIIFSNPAMDEIQMMVNGSCLASTNPASLRYMRLLGHLPALLHPDPKDVLVGCFGTGTTCGAIALHPEVKNLDLVELSKMVLNAAPLFKLTNHDVLLDPKVHKHVTDVRNFLLTSDKQYDVVTFEPPPPCDAGIVNLYTSEFYSLVNRHLKDAGIMCQWVPMDQDSNRLWRKMAASARAVFPYVTIWLPNNREAVLTASRLPIRMNFAQIQQRIDASAQVKDSLSEVGLGSAMSLASTWLISGTALDQYINDAVPVTDDHPALEFFLPWAGPLTVQTEVEAAGRKQLSDIVNQSTGSDGFDIQSFKKNWQAIHLLRQSANFTSPQQADPYINAALSLMLRSHWWNFVDKHRWLFNKPPEG